MKVYLTKTPSFFLHLVLLVFAFFSCSDKLEIEPQKELFESVTLLTQQEVDDFARIGVERIEGDLFIGGEGSDITTLAELSTIKVITGKLRLTELDELTDIDGLFDIDSVNGIEIYENDQLKSIHSFDPDYLNSFSAYYNGELESISGFDKLEQMGFSVNVSVNDALQSIDGFSSLKSVPSIDIQINPRLRRINAFEQLEVAEFRARFIQVPSLESVAFLSNLRETSTLVFSEINELTEIDLPNLERVEDVLFFNQIPNIQHFSGFGKLQQTEELSISSMSSLRDLTGFEGLSEISNGFEVSNCDSLTSLKGLENVTMKAYPDRTFIRLAGIELTDLPRLTDISSLSGIVEVQNIGIYRTGLQQLNGLEDLSFVANKLNIESNLALTDYCALSNLLGNGWSGESDGFTIQDNEFNPSRRKFRDGICKR